MVPPARETSLAVIAPLPPEPAFAVAVAILVIVSL